MAIFLALPNMTFIQKRNHCWSQLMYHGYIPCHCRNGAARLRARRAVFDVHHLEQTERQREIIYWYALIKWSLLIKKERKKNERALCTLSHHLFGKECVLESQILPPHTGSL